MTASIQINKPSPVPLAIVGMGCLFPGATDAHGFWANVREGVDCITDVPATHWNPEDYFNADQKKPDHTYAARGGFIPQIDFRPLDFGITPTAIEATDTSQLLGLVAARQALEDAGYGAGREFDRSRTSVILGVTGALELVIPLGARLGHPLWRKALAELGVDAETADKVVDRISHGYVEWQENSFPGLLGNVVAGRIANRLDLGGTNCVVDAACASSLSALHLAALELQAGLSDMVVTGGVDTFNDIFMYMCFSKTPALSPTGNAKPFAADGDGTILGEGIGVLVIKRLADAQAAGDRIYAILKGIGSSSDGKGNAIYAPSADGQKKALRNAYRLANVQPDSIELVEAHGTGTKVGDATELSALADVYRETGPRATRCAVGSVKSQIGHTKAAAGAAGLMKAALALHHKTLPPSIKIDKPLETLVGRSGPFYLNSRKRPWVGTPGRPRRAAVSAFGFGGSNFHCVLEEASTAKMHVDWSEDIEIVALSGSDDGVLIEGLEALVKCRDWATFQAAAAQSRSAFSGKAAVRATLVVERSEFEGEKKSLAAARQALIEPNRRLAKDDAVFVGRTKPGKLAAIFSGQGSQTLGMARDLACQFPEMLEALQRANEIAGRSNPSRFESLRLSDAIDPPPAFDDEIAKRDEAMLRSTDVAQPALAAIELGMLGVLERFGVRFDFFAGHSFGELSALHAAGVIDADALLTLACQRGRLMADAGGADAGGMLAVHASAGEVESAVRESGLQLTIANKNGPSQTVVSGSNAELANAEAVFGRRKLRSTRLPVAAAFHSPLVAVAAKEFRQRLDAVEIDAPRLPVYSNSTAHQYPADAGSIRDLLGNQLARPVEFVAMIEGMVAAGTNAFVEIGPGSKLARLIATTADRIALAVDSSEGRRHGMLDLARLLAQLASLGHEVRLDAWNEGVAKPIPTTAAKRAFTVRLSGANYVPKERREVWKAGQRPGNGVAAQSTSLTAMTPPVKQAAAANRNSATPAPPILQSASPLVLGPKLERLAPPKMEPQFQTALTQPQPPAGAASQALELIQRNLDALRRMQEQTSQVHLRYLEGQEAALSAYRSLTEAQQRVLSINPIAQLPASQAPAVPLAAAPVALPPAPITRQIEASQPVPSRTESALQTKRQSAPVPIAAAPQIQPSSSAPAKAATSGLVNGLLGIVAEKTGYPVEMLELDMQLDADLGIDSIKRVEILSAVQEKFPEAPSIGSDQIGSIRTLREVVGLLDHATGSPEKGSTPGKTTQTAVASATDSQLTPGVLSIVAEKTGYPVEMLELDMQLDADLGIDSIKRVEILSAVQEQFPEAPTIQSDQIGSIRTLREVINHLEQGAESTAQLAAAPPQATAAGAPSTTNIRISPVVRYVVESYPLPPASSRPALSLGDGEIIVMAGSLLSDAITQQLRDRGRKVRVASPEAILDAEPPRRILGLIVVAPDGSTDKTFLANTLQVVRKLGPALRHGAASGAAVLATLSRLDGRFGFESAPVDELSGALAGLTKTAAREWPEVRCRALDIDKSATADGIVDEILVEGPIETSIGADGVCGLRLTESPLVSGASHRALSESDVVIVSGGARGVTAAVAIALAKAYRPRLVLLGRTALAVAPEPAWQSEATTESELKRALAAHLPAGTTPKQISRQAAAILANREIRGTLEAIKAVGAKASYHAVDVRDAEAVGNEIAVIERKYGRVTGLVHGSGVLADRKIDDKTPEDFEAVFGVKVDGFANLLEAVGTNPLKALVTFSSTTARLGRVGQVDYAMANEALNKLAQAEQRRRPDCKVVSANWGPWAGGMVKSELMKVFANEGIGLIDLVAGGAALVAELESADGPVEVVFVGSKLPRSELGLETESTTGRANQVTAEARSCIPASAAAEAAIRWELAFERELDLATHPILEAHILDGRAVLPLALMMEWLAHAALHVNPGLSFHGLDEVRVLKRLTIEPGKRSWVQAVSARAVKSDGLFRAPVELRSRKADGQIIVHAVGAACLAADLPTSKPVLLPTQAEAYPWSTDQVYEQYLFHGPELRGIESIEVCSAEGLTAKVAAAPASEDWLVHPLRGDWLADPMALDCVFQLMIVWTFENHGIGSLPTGLGRYRQFRRRFPVDGSKVVIRIKRHSDRKALADVELIDGDGVLVARIDDYECTLSESLKRAFQLNRLALAERQ